MKVSYLLAAVVGISCVPFAKADIVTLGNGDKITGTIDQVNSKTVVVTTPYAGKVTIERASVKTLFSEKPVEIVREDATTDSKFLSPAETGTGWTESAAFVPMPPPPDPAAPVRHTKFLSIGPDWTNELAIGLVNTTGNDETTSFVGSLILDYKKKPDQVTFKMEGAYGVSNGAQNAAFFGESLIWRHDLNEKWYGYANESALYDGIKGISIQATGTVGLGYYFYRTEKFLLDMRGGPGITYQQTFDGNEDTNLAIQVASRAEYVLNDRVSTMGEIIYTVAATDPDIWQMSGEVALKVKLDVERGLGLKLGFIDMYDNAPSAGRANNDTRLTLALTFGF